MKNVTKSALVLALTLLSFSASADQVINCSGDDSSQGLSFQISDLTNPEAALVVISQTGKDIGSLKLKFEETEPSKYVAKYEGTEGMASMTVILGQTNFTSRAAGKLIWKEKGVRTPEVILSCTLR